MLSHVLLEDCLYCISYPLYCLVAVSVQSTTIEDVVAVKLIVGVGKGGPANVLTVSSSHADAPRVATALARTRTL